MALHVKSNAQQLVAFETMPGSPRVEKAAKCRIQHPNFSIEMAMISAGYSHDEAKDERRRSNVRQKVHRLTKGIKRAAEEEMLEGEGARQNPELPPEMNGIEISNARHGALQPHSLVSSPRGMPVVSSIEYSRRAGSPRVGTAARTSIENPNLTVEQAMKCSGYSADEARDKKRQNNIRQKKRRVKEKMKSHTTEGALNISETILQIQQQVHQISQQHSHIQHNQFQIQQQLNLVAQSLQLTNQSLNSIAQFSGGNGHASQSVHQVVEEVTLSVPAPHGGVSCPAPHGGEDDDTVPI